MKTTLLTIAAIFATTIAFAQSPNFDKGMTKGLEMMKSAKSGEDFLATANFFERVATTEKTQWLPFYYSAYNLLVSGHFEQDQNKKDGIFDKALNLTLQAQAIQPTNSELEALAGYIKLMKVYVDPMNRYMDIQAAMGNLQKAKELDQNNPRAAFILAQNTFYTPEAYGGGKKLALPMLQDAMKKFENYKPAFAFAPDWGAERCKTLLDEAQK
ncbi:hypothetical protein NF867_08885 [Solitalea sp. MAHUQ-68]|uniref:Tetratricopeptide repeat protein n=1 Tax=Solitalea agri TaxID=2953739 RepID=A0A9X2JDJ4_9SPHI|nr:hypothetical protein [Solitalea agri]MCO4292975.1 hypothetical protein [Solitalea agri]